MGGKFLSIEEKALEDKIYGFFGEEEEEENFDDSDQSFDCDWRDNDDDESNRHESSRDSNEQTEFWESQECLLQEILEHRRLTCSKLRQEITKVIEMARETDFCNCSKLNSDGCLMCLRRRVVNLLCNKGFNATLFTSKWKRTQKFPGGTHEYIEVIASTPGRKKQVAILIELEFRDEFRMGKACENYCKLIDQLPEIYIGKPEHLNAIVRVVCDAAKRSTTERKIHMGPWRKRSFMEMKWSASHKRLSLDQSSINESPLVSSRQLHIPSVRSCLQFSAATAVEVA